MFERLRADGQQRNKAERDGWREVGGGWSQKSAHRWGEWNVAKRERGSGGPGSGGNVRSRTVGRGAAWELLEKKWKQWQPGKEEEEKAAAWGKELWAMADQEGRQKEAETGKGSLKTTAWSW